MNATVEDLRPTIVPKSDQLNAEQLLGGSMTVTVTNVTVSDSGEQPVVVHYEGEGGRPFKPCKTMRKVLIHAWGADGRKWIGRSMTLYNDPSVKFGGDDVGGIRISHMTDIERDVKVSLTSTRGKKAKYEIKRLTINKAGRVPVAVTLKSVMEAIAAANDPEGMQDAAGLAAKLTDDEDKAAAREAYDARLQDLKAAAAPASSEQGNSLAYSDVAAKLNRATDIDELGAAADLIQYVESITQRDDLAAIYKRKSDEFKG